jgi:16S rRNA (cytosine967-C5)-methyltransferase
MKLYKNLVNSVAQTLQEIFLKKRYADKALERVFKDNPQWGSRDRRFVAEGVYDTVRNFRLYSELAETTNNYWFITAVWLVLKDIEIPEWPEFRHLNSKLIKSRHEALMKEPRIALSYPDWLWELASKELGEDKWLQEATAMNEQAPVSLRANTLKQSATELSAALLKEGISTTPGNYKDALELVKRENVFKSNLFKEGKFEVQDSGSQQISAFLDPRPGQFVIDACAGGGGKSLHIAALMQNKGKIISMDVESWKLEELKKRARRAGVFNVETRLIEDKTIAGLKGMADRVLLDVPCSGTGVLKRNPDSKWKLSEDTIEKTRFLQRSILSNYCAMTKKDGILVYSTCSILPSENKEQVDSFLKTNPDFTFVEDKMLWPSLGTDGFYMARMKRVN